jgi:hypothetical protein
MSFHTETKTVLRSRGFAHLEVPPIQKDFSGRAPVAMHTQQRRYMPKVVRQVGRAKMVEPVDMLLWIGHDRCHTTVGQISFCRPDKIGAALAIPWCIPEKTDYACFLVTRSLRPADSYMGKTDNAISFTRHDHGF